MKASEVHNSLDFTCVSLTYFHFRRQKLDLLESGFCRIHIRRSHKDLAVVVDIDLNSGLFDDLIDRFSSRSDDCSDLVRRNLNRDDSRSVRRQFLSRCRNFLQHLLSDVSSAVVSLLQRSFQDFSGKSMNLDIHLNRGYAPFPYPPP